MNYVNVPIFEVSEPNFRTSFPTLVIITSNYWGLLLMFNINVSRETLPKFVLLFSLGSLTFHNRKRN